MGATASARPVPMWIGSLLIGEKELVLMDKAVVQKARILLKWYFVKPKKRFLESKVEDSIWRFTWRSVKTRKLNSKRWRAARLHKSMRIHCSFICFLFVIYAYRSSWIFRLIMLQLTRPDKSMLCLKKVIFSSLIAKYKVPTYIWLTHYEKC